MITNYRAGRIRSGIRMAQRQRPKMRRVGQHRTIISSSLLVTFAFGLILLFTLPLNRQTQATTNVHYGSDASGNTGTLETYDGINWETSGYAAESCNFIATECEDEVCNENQTEPTGCMGIDYYDNMTLSYRMNLSELQFKTRIQLENN